MKRMLKKLTAIALAGAMALSLSVTALAADPITDLASAEGQATGQVEPPTAMPDNKISIRMPTAANGTFDFWFDPHNLIRLSNNALNVGGDGNTTVDVSAFATDTLVYFKNAGDTVKFSKTSDDIEIINRSNVPVSVEMSTTWTKPATDSYTLSKDAAEFEAANTAGEAALSLVLQDTKNDSAYVVEKEKSTPVMLWEAKETKVGTGGTATDVQAAQSAIEGLIKDIKFEWLSGATAQDIKNINLGGTATGEVTPADWTFQLAAGSKKPPAVTFTNVASIPKYKTSSGTNITETGYTAKSSTPVTINEYKEIDGSYTYSLPNTASNADVVVTISRGNVNVAEITIEWDYKALGDFHKSQGTTSGGTTTYPTNYVYGIDNIAGDADANHSKVELVIKAQPGDGALIKTALNRVDGAYQIGPKNGGGLEYQLQEPFSSDDTKFQSLKFNLTGAITDSEKAIAAWDKAYKSARGGASMTVKWKVTACDAVDPSAEVTTAMYSASDSPVLKVDWGYGSKLASAITGGSFTAGNGSALTLPASAFVVDDTDNSVITVNVGTNGNALFGGNGKVTLTFDTGATAVVALKAADAT